MRTIPEPNYNPRIKKLTDAYKRAVRDILRELERYDVTDLSRANSAAMLAEISRILSEVDAEAKAWVVANVPSVALDGTAKAIVNLGAAKTIEEAREIASFNRANKALIEAAIADTQADLLAVTQNMDRKTRGAVRKVVSESFRANMAKGINGPKTIKADVLAGLRKTLGDAVNTGIIDAGGRRWKPQHYAEMVTRTKLMSTYNESTTNEAVDRGAYYGIITSHGATDACRFHEGRIVKLISDAPGNYPTIDELRATGQIFHPNCKHSFSVMRNVDVLPSAVKEKADKQAERGGKAIAAGGRNPKDVD